MIGEPRAYLLYSEDAACRRASPAPRGLWHDATGAIDSLRLDAVYPPPRLTSAMRCFNVV